MVVVELCRNIKKCKTASEKDLVFSEFFHSIREGYDSSILCGLSISDLSNLDTHSLCDILAIIEYIADSLEISLGGMLLRFEGLSCPKEDNQVYILLKNSLGEEKASELYSEWLDSSIEPFKSRGIIAREFNYAV